MSDQPDQDGDHRKMQWEGELAQWRANADRELESWRVDAEGTLQRQIAMYRGLVEFALVALKGVVLVNGGAALAILAFLGSIWTASPENGQQAAIQLAPALQRFVLGTGFGVLAAALAYLAQTAFAELPRPKDAKGTNWNWIVGSIFRVCAIASAAGGIVTFWMGTQSAIYIFSSG